MKNVVIGLVLIMTVALFAAPAALAAWVSVGGNQGAGVKVLESTPGRIALEFRVGGFERNDLVIDGRTYSMISLPGEAQCLEKGFPELPLVARSVIIPDDRNMELRVTALEYTELHGVTPVPSKGDLLRNVDPARVPFTFDAFYSSDHWFPARDASPREPYVLRDYRGTTVVVTPFRYQPSTGTLRVATRMVVELVDAGPGGANVLARNRPRSSVAVSFDEVYRHHFLNYGMQAEKYIPAPETGSMIVICYDAFAPAIQPFVDWKNQSGLPTTMYLLSQVGSTAEQVSSFIAARYNASTSPKLAFVLLVGDAEQMPTPYSQTSAADPTYGKIVGADWYPEIFIGRFSAENYQQAQTQALRSIDYEKSLLPAGGDWCGLGTGIGSQFGPGDDGEFDYQHIANIRTKLLNYGYTSVDTLYGAPATAAQVTAALLEGRSIINYTGHGSQNAWGTTGFSSIDVAALENDNRLPFIISVACVNGRFPGGACFAEAWLRATHNGSPTGAVAAYMASNNQPWNPPMAAQDEAVDLLVQDRARTFASLCFNGSCQMIDEYGVDGASTFNAWHIFGDPSLRVRTKPPVGIVATHPDSISVGTASVEVMTNCPGAICGLAVGGVYFGSGVADSSGTAAVAVTGALGGGENLTLTITGYNRIPYIAPIEVRPLPALIVAPTTFHISVQREAVVTDTLRLINFGGATDSLPFRLTVFTQGENGFLSLGADSGMIAYGDTATVQVYFSAQTLPAGNYNSLIRVAYNLLQTTSVTVGFHVGDVSAVPGDRVLPETVAFRTAGPNPFAGSVHLDYGLPSSQAARLVIYDTAGRVVRTLVGGTVVAGYHKAEWNGRDEAGRAVPTGVYFARLETSARSLTLRLLRIR